MDVDKIHADFPALTRTVNGQRIAYLDNAATTQKPQLVIDTITEYYEEHNANVHRCIHTLAEEATELYDGAHDTVARFINATPEEVIFTKNTTESLNLVAYAHGMQELGPDDEIVLTEMEHHSMLVPWQQVAERTGATIRYAPVDADGTLDMAALRDLVTDDTAVVGVVHASNVLGTVNPVSDIADIAHAHDALCVVDAAQSAPHLPIDVGEIGADFLAFSGHKMCGPTGIGVLYGRQELLEDMEPFLYGGDMISRVTKSGAEWNELPAKFEAGTPHVAGAAGLAAAIDYLADIGMARIEQHGRDLGTYTYEQLSSLDGVTVYGPEDRIGLAAFTVADAHPHDLSTLLNEQGIAIRGGHHCAQPLGEVLGVSSTARASFYLYNTRDEVDRLVDAVRDAREVFA